MAFYCNREEQILTLCWICFFYFNLCFLCFCYYNHCLPLEADTMACHREPCPSKLTVKLEYLWSAHRQTFWPCSPVKGCRKEINITLPQDWLFQEISARLRTFLLYFLTSFPSLFYKRNWHPDPDKRYSQTLVYHLCECRAFWIKSLFLASTPHLSIIGLSCGKQTELGFVNN